MTRAVVLTLTALFCLGILVSACSAIAGLSQFSKESCAPGGCIDAGKTPTDSSTGGHVTTLGGTVSGLLGKGLVVANGSEMLPVSSNGPFAFAMPEAAGATYDVTIATQPSSPTQVCTLLNGRGTVGASSVTNVLVKCVGGGAYPVGGGVSGLTGTLVLEDNGGDDLTLTANGAFTFKTLVASGSPYAVTIKTQPAQQTCAVAMGSGTVANAPVTSVNVTCQAQTFTVGGMLTGLAPGDGIVLQNNAGDNLTLTANGAFTFATPGASGAPYLVTILSPPSSPAQSCTVSGGVGSIANANVTTVAVSCITNTYVVGGTIFGLQSSITLEDNGGNNLSLTTNGSFAFSTELASGASYAVTVFTQPASPAQTCNVSGGTGMVGSGPVTSVVVNCAANTYTVGGMISGLAGTIVLQNNLVDNLTLTANGSFAFSTPVPSGQNYSVTILTQPGSPSQTCVLTGNTGTVSNADIQSVNITCTTNSFTIGGSVSNLAGSGLVLTDNGGDNLNIGGNGGFTFATSIASGMSYAVAANQPSSPTQTCNVTNGSGTVGGANVTNVAVNCQTDSFTIGGTVSGLPAGESVVLVDNGSDVLTVSADGNFAFSTSVLSGATYSATVMTQPTTVNCGITNGSGTVGGANVSNIVVTCSSLYYPSGPQQNVPTTSLIGWTLCYQDLYDVEMSTTIGMIQSSCTGTYTLMACAPVPSTGTYQLLAAGPTASVFTNTGSVTDSTVTTVANGVGWYFDTNFSWGFVPAADAPENNECDILSTPDDDLRLCWHTVSGAGGYRCGSDLGLNGSTTYARFVFSAP